MGPPVRGSDPVFGNSFLVGGGRGAIYTAWHDSRNILSLELLCSPVVGTNHSNS